MWSLLSKLWTRKRWRDEDTREALDGPMPLGTEAFPFEAPLGTRSSWIFLGHLIGLALPSITIAYLGYLDLLAIALLASGLAISLAAGLNALQAAGRKIRVSEESIRVRRLLSEDVLPWWQIGVIAIDPKLTLLRIAVDSRTVRVHAAALSVDQRKRLVWAIRARAEPLNMLIKLDRRRRFAFQPVPVAFNLAGWVLIVAAINLSSFHAVPALGIRCSAASQYLRTRFASPDHRGCVIVRVSGAAERVGIRQGDLMIEMDGIAITSGRQYSAVFNKSGSHVTFLVLRPGVPEPLHFDFGLARGGSPDTPKSDALFYFLRARLDAANGAVKEPIADYTRAIEIAPDFDLAYLYRGQLYEGQPDGQALAFTDYETALRLSPDLAEVQRQMAYLYQNHALRDESLAAAQRAIQLDGCVEIAGEYNVDCSADYYTLAIVSHPLQYRVIAEASDSASDFDPEYSDPYFVAAQAYAALGDRQALADRAAKYTSMPPKKIEPAKVRLLQDLIAHPEIQFEQPVTPEIPPASVP